MQLKDHQQSLIDRNPHRYLIAHGAGSGKTITLLALARINEARCVIVCPKKIKPQWEAYNATWGAQHLVLSKEEFKKHVTMTINLFNTTDNQYNGFIFDECHYVGNPTSQLSKLVYKYIEKYQPQYRWLATGTPLASNPPMNVYSYGRILGKNWSYWGFIKQFYNQVNMGTPLVPVLKQRMEGELASYIKEIGETLALEDVVVVPEQKDIVEYFDLTKEQKEAIKSLNEPLAITQFTKEHCIEQGLLYSDGYTEDKTYHCLKNERLLEIIKEDKQYIVFVRYTKQIEFLKDIIKNKYPLKDIFILNGQVKDKDTKSVLDGANNSTNCVFIVQADTAEGWEFSKCDTAIFMSMSFSHIKHLQAKARILRINNLKENTYYYLVTKGVDKEVHKTIMRKKDFHIDIFNRGRVL